MTNRVSRWWLVLPALGLALWCGRPRLDARDDKPADAGKRPSGYYGTSACQVGCHGGAKPMDDPKNDLVCRCNELTLWSANDKHADAYNVLLGERGQQILAALYKNKDPKQAAACLSCHAAVVKDEKAAREDGFLVEEGVSCFVCHGPLGSWYGEHSLPALRVRFRKLSPAEKASVHGMTNVWDPLRRSQLCVSCHVGSAAEKKVVTHEMYAAGHPPLPGFELASFCDMMPPHWESRSAKAARGVKSKSPEQARLALVGAAVSMAEYLKVVAAQAAEEKVIDWANFDCYSCHHDLKSPGWRQASRGLGKPGRVPAKEWPAMLLPLAQDDPAEFQRMWDEVRTAFVARPFGDVGRVAKSAAALAAWAEKLASRLNESPVDRGAMRKGLAKLPSAGQVPDFDSARQLAWAYRAMIDEPAAAKEPPGLAELTLELGLQFPARRMRPGDTEGVIVRDLGASLKRLNDYDPGKFLKLWRGLAPAERSERGR